MHGPVRLRDLFFSRKVRLGKNWGPEPFNSRSLEAKKRGGKRGKAMTKALCVFLVEKKNLPIIPIKILLEYAGEYPLGKAKRSPFGALGD